MDLKIKKETLSWLQSTSQFISRVITLLNEPEEIKESIKQPEKVIEIHKLPYDYSTKLSDHFTLGEFLVINPETFKKAFPGKEPVKTLINGSIKNVLPLSMVTQSHVDNLKRLCIERLEPIRLKYGKPVNISQGGGFRPGSYNFYAGGVTNSYHQRAKGADVTISGITPSKIYKDFIQYRKSGEFVLEPSWVHVAVS